MYENFKILESSKRSVVYKCGDLAFIFTVSGDKNGVPIWELFFKQVNEEWKYCESTDEYEDDYEKTNNNKPLSVAKVMCEIMTDFMKNRVSEYVIEIFGLYQDGEDMQDTSVRTKLFIRAINKYLPGKKIVTKRNVISINSDLLDIYQKSLNCENIEELQQRQV